MIKQSIDEQWRAAFLQTVQQHDRAQPLKEAALEGRLGAWTKDLTASIASRDPAVVYLAVAPQWDSLRRDPRFSERLRRLALLAIA